MERIKIVCDSTCDLPAKYLKQRRDIDVLPVRVTIGGKPYLDWIDYDMPTFYKLLNESGEPPTTAQVPPGEFKAAYARAVAEGYTHIIAATINKNASGMYGSSVIGKKLFFEENPGAKVEIENVDTTTYSVLFGTAVRQVAEQIDRGLSFREAAKMLHDVAFSYEAVIVPDTLKYLQRTGRVSKVTGTVGEILNVKPLLQVGHGGIELSATVRGRKKVNPAMLQFVKERLAPGEDEIFFAGGDSDEEANSLLCDLSEMFPERRLTKIELGSAIVINTGPRVKGIAYRRKL